MLSEFFPCSRRVVFIAEQYKIPLFRSTMVVCGRRHVTYVCFIDKKRTNPLSLWTLKKNKNTQNGMKIIWYIRALENVNLVSTIISMIYSIWLLSMVRFSINIEWNIDKNLSFNNRYPVRLMLYSIFKMNLYDWNLNCNFYLLRILLVNVKAKYNFMLVSNGCCWNVAIKECFDTFFLVICSLFYTCHKIFRFTLVIKSHSIKARKIANLNKQILMCLWKWILLWPK